MKNKPDRRKVSVITLHTSINYGSLLQTYATKVVFEKLGWDVEFVNYIRNNNTTEAHVQRIFEKRAYKKINKLSFGIFENTLKSHIERRLSQRTVPFLRFLRQFIPMTIREYHSIEELRADPPVADVYCTGSDQVWNSIWNEGIELPYFLDYAPKGKRRIAFAASIGHTDIDSEEKAVLVDLLIKYSAISMRERSGVELLASMGIASEWVLDPTLMLTSEQWRVLEPPISEKKGSFILLYVLNWSDKVEMLAKKLGSEFGLRILRIRKSESRLYKASGIEDVIPDKVEELLSYFDAASMILTDSFHATAFSLNLHKRFLAFPPPRFSSRLESILELTGAKEHCYLPTWDAVLPDGEADWIHVEQVLDVERQKTLNFLENSLCDE